MTTGRINQVTILCPSTKRTQANPPKGAGSTKQGDAEAIQVAALKALKHRQRKQLIQLPPLSSPKGGPQRAMTNVSTTSFPLHTPLRRRKPTPRHALDAETQQSCPQGSGEYLAKPAIHRPQMVPNKRFEGASVTATRSGAVPERNLLDIGMSQPKTCRRELPSP